MAIHIDTHRRGKSWNTPAPAKRPEDARIDQVARRRPELALAMAVVSYDTCLVSASVLAARGKRMRELADIVLAREAKKNPTPEA